MFCANCGGEIGPNKECPNCHHVVSQEEIDHYLKGKSSHASWQPRAWVIIIGIIACLTCIGAIVGLPLIITEANSRRTMTPPNNQGWLVTSSLFAGLFLLILLSDIKKGGTPSPANQEETIRRGKNHDGSSTAYSVVLHAKYTVRGTVITLHNQDSFDWDNVEIYIIPDNGTDPYGPVKGERIVQGQSYSVKLSDFSGFRSKRFDPKVGQIVIWCDSPKGRGFYNSSFEDDRSYWGPSEKPLYDIKNNDLNARHGTALPPDPSLHGIPINASIAVTDNYVIMTNNDSYDWVGLFITITPGQDAERIYVYMLSQLPAGKRCSIALTKFADSDLKHFNPRKDPPVGQVLISCDIPQGTGTTQQIIK